MAADRLELHDVEADIRRTVTVGNGTVYVTVDAEGGARLGSEANGAVLRIVPTRRGRRVEPVAAGGQVAVNGELLFCKDLEAGDVVELGRTRLRWLPVVATAPLPQPAGPGTARHRRGRPAPAAARPSPHGRRRRQRLLLPLTLFVIACGGFVLAIRSCWHSTWPSSPQHYVDLARSQFQNLRTDEALATLEFALREATGSAREQALGLQQEIRRAQVAMLDVPRVQAARRAQDLLASFRDRYLRNGAGRPEAREFVRQCDRWLQEHREVCERSEQARTMLRQVEAWRQEQLPASGLPDADQPADVIFAARARLRFVVREYRAAVALLDAHLALHPDAAAVRAERDAMVRDGAEWLRGKLHQVERALDRGDRAEAEARFRELERDAILPEWEEIAASCRARLRR